MNKFESELRKIVGLSSNIRNAKFIGKACIFRLGKDVTGKISLTTGIMAGRYDRLRIELFNRSEGRIDVQTVTFEDMIGRFKIHTGEMLYPYIWESGTKTDWYAFTPSERQYKVFADTIDGYLDCFIEPEMSETDDIEM